MYYLKKKENYWCIVCGSPRFYFPVSEHFRIARKIKRILISYHVSACHIADVIEDFLT